MKEGWIYKKLGDLVNIRTGKLDANAADENGQYPFFTCSVTPLKINTYAYDCECVLVAGNGDLNVKYYNGKFNAYQRTYIIESKEKDRLSTYYLYKFYELYINELRKQSVGSTIKYIKLGNLTESIIPIPSLSEQRAIVEKLDAQFARLDQLKANAEKELAEAKGLFQKTLEEYLSPKEGWEEKKLEEVCNIIGGATPSKKEKKYYTGNIPWVTVRDMNVDILTETEFSITNEAVKSCSTHIIPRGEIIIATRVGLGKVCLLGKEAAINQDLKGIVPKHHNISRTYLYYWFKSIADKIVKNGVGATVQGVKITFIEALDLPLPPLSEQRAIVEKLDAISERVHKLEDNCKTIATYCDDMKQQILKETFG